MRIAALDVGSNSFHLIVVQVTATGHFEVLDRAKEMVRLGEGSLRSGIIPPDVFRRGLEALASLRRIADRHQPDALVAIATSAVREAQNGGEFVRAARDEVGVDIQVVRGQEEARLIYLGARSSLDLDGRRTVLFDLGGGSMEVILADARECYFTDSLKLGVIRMTEEWGASDPPTAREISMLRERLRREMVPVIARVRSMGFDFVSMSSGTASALASLIARDDDKEKEKKEEGAVRKLTMKALTEVERKLATLTHEQRMQLPGIDSRRADTILAGAIVLRTALELTGSEEATVCEAALREGIVADYIVTHRPGILLVDEFPDLRRRSVMELARRCHFDEAHAQHVTRLALSLFDQTREVHGLGEEDEELLEWAALLHDVGFYISPSGHHKHAQYLIETAGMVGFSRDEVEIIALAARYHRKAEPPARVTKRSTRRRHAAFSKLSRRTRKRVRYLAALLRIADALDRTHGRLVRAVRCQVKRKTIELRVEVDGDPELELWAARRKGDVLESLSGLRLRLAVDAVTRVRAAAPRVPLSAKPIGTRAGRPPLKAAPRPAKKQPPARRLTLVG
ncbi:MAG TPA: Ppx/GppA phosphatase family protein [Polyangia bacterium]|jgi:exopolyphosphatase/guanosine-5'-triphosphate,3'-diphosphate pyrophosphatase